MGYNKVILGNEVLLDLSGDTVTPETMVKGIIAHNAAGERIVGTMEVAISRLPAGYTELAYIQSTGTQYIVTNFKPKYNSRVVMDIEGLGTSATWVFGAKNKNTSTESKQFALIRIDSSNIRADYFGGKTASLAKSDASARTTIDMNGNVTTMYGQTVTNPAVTSGAVDYPLALFTCNLGNDLSRSKAAIKLYSCKIYDGNTLVLDFYPCINPEGEAGLYDLVEGEFYGNDGTGEFKTSGDSVSISVSSGGLITATAGDKSATKQLPTKAGTTITPITSVQTAIAKGTYATGDIKVAAVSGGGNVSSGTVTRSGSGSSFSIDTGVTVKNNDTFFMRLVGYSGLMDPVVYLYKDKNLTDPYVAIVHSDENTVETKSVPGGFSASGTKITVSMVNDPWDNIFMPGTYEWRLVGG